MPSRLFYRGPKDNVGLERWAVDVSTGMDKINGALTRVQQQALNANNAATTTISTQALPPQLKTFSVSATPYYQDGSAYEQVTATYTAPSPLGTFAGVFVVVTGYNGNSAPIKVAEDSYTGAPGGTQSFSFKLYRTNELVTFYGVPRNSLSGAPTPWTDSLSGQLTLGQVTPPATVGGVTATNQPGGVQLTWTANTEKNLAGYKIYRGPTSSFSAASLVWVMGIARSGAPQWFDSTAEPGQTYYYFVTGVNSADEEGTASTGVSIGATVSATLGSVTGTQANRIPDAGIFMPGTYWGTLPAGCTVQNGSGQGPTLTFTESGQVTGAAFPVVAGKIMTLSGFIDASGCTAGDTPNWNLWYPEISQYAAGANQSVGAVGRVSATLTIPAGVTKAQCVCGGTIHGVAYFNHPQLEAGSVMTAYKPNILDDFTGGLNTGIQVQEPGGALSPVVLGDAHQRSRTAIESDFGIAAGKVGWRAFLGDTSGDFSGNVADAGNKRFLHGAMSGGVQGVVDTTGYIYPDTGLGAGYGADLGLVHDQATAPVVCPVTGTEALVALTTLQEFTPTFSIPTWVEYTMYINGTSGAVMFDAGFGHGYAIYLDGRNGNFRLRIFRAGDERNTATWTALASYLTNTSTVTGWFLVQVFVGRAGLFQVYLNGVLAATATDTTYTPNGSIWGGYDSGAASIGAASAAVPDPTQLDGNARAIIDGASAHVNWSQDHLPNGSIYGRSAVTQLDANGNIIVLGTAGTGPQWQIGNGGVNISTGGSQVKRTVTTESVSLSNSGATYANGQVFYFSSANGSPSLLDQAGGTLPPFDNPPYVALAAVGMTTPPTQLYASGITTTQFTLNAYNGATSSSDLGLTNNVAKVYTVPAGDTATQIKLTADVVTTLCTAGGHYCNQNDVFNVPYTVTPGAGGSGGGSGTIQIKWSSTGQTFHGSANVNVNIPAGDTVTVTLNWGSPSGNISSTAGSGTVVIAQITPASGVNFAAQIAEVW